MYHICLMGVEGLRLLALHDIAFFTSIQINGFRPSIPFGLWSEWC